MHRVYAPLLRSLSCASFALPAYGALTELLHFCLQFSWGRASCNILRPPLCLGVAQTQTLGARGIWVVPYLTAGVPYLLDKAPWTPSLPCN